ncbi:MAG: aminotransferase class V-fold PLP-dependent enzyme [Patescibacteria group bacterium]
MSMKTGKKRIYLDYASATPISEKAYEALVKMSNPKSDFFGNHSSTHSEGVLTRDLLLEIRTNIARNLEVHKDEIIFTSGATEGNNLIISGVYKGTLGKIKKPHFITSIVDHSSVLGPIENLKKRGASVTYLKPNRSKILDLSELEKSLNESTVLISLSYVNSEIGNIVPVRDVRRLINKFKNKLGRGLTDYPYLHVDASQAVNSLAVNPHNLGADFLVLDGAKMYGPKGVGVIVSLRERKIFPIIFGGGQEKGIRPGTVNLASAHSFSVAFNECLLIREKENKRLETLQKYFENELKKNFPKCIINGESEKRVPNFTNVCLPKLDAEYAIAQLDALSVAASSASACQSAGGEGFSYVIKELVNGKDCAGSSIRFSMGRDTKSRDLKIVVESLKKVANLQNVSST